jgi:D-tagatose-1,6-bisphosphate aldolase subunit GatZ/KbaZ
MLRQLVQDGFAILKVGPGLTFALREALYGLDQIATFLFPDARRTSLAATTDRVMLERPENWDRYYHGTPAEQRLQRHYSYSDRIRYYWPDDEVADAVSELISIFDGRTIPETMISQYLKAVYPGVRAGQVEPTAMGLILASVGLVLKDYHQACSS